MIQAFHIQERLGLPGIWGEKDRSIDRVGPLGTVSPGCLTFISRPPAEVGVPALIEKLMGAAVICGDDTAARLIEGGVSATIMTAPNPRLAFMRAVGQFFAPERPAPGIHPTAVIDPTAHIDATASIGPYCVVGAGCRVGPDTILHAHVSLYQDVKVGARVSINGGTVIGADGFGYERNEAGELEKFPHIGGVTIEDDVEIGSNTSIDRGALEDTHIARGARIDNQVHIAHNVWIGEDAAIIAQCMVGGSARIGDRAWLAPASVLMNKAVVGADATVGLGAVVIKLVGDGETVMGSPAVPDHEFRATRAAIKELVRAAKQT